jgi:hypothetical protein
LTEFSYTQHYGILLAAVSAEGLTSSWLQGKLHSPTPLVSQPLEVEAALCLNNEVEAPLFISSPTMASTTSLVHTPTSQPTASASEISPSVQPPLVLPQYPPSPGTWRHPKFTEIVKRQSASTFSDRDLRRALCNALALILSFFFTSPIHTA